MKKVFGILVISMGIMLFSACTQADAGICEKLGETCRDAYEDVGNAYSNMFSYIAEGRYLIQYPDKNVSRMGIYDLETLESSRFGDYVIRYDNSFCFTGNMTDTFFMTAMGDVSFQDNLFFTYDNEEGKLQFALYFDGKNAGCGICYNNEEWSGELEGFLFRECKQMPWEESAYFDLYDLKKFYSGVEDYKEELRNYKEQYEYNDVGQVTEFHASAETDIFTDGWEPITVAGYTCEYNDDGSIRKQELFRHALLFETFASTNTLYYDEQGRIAYTRSYITHGFLEYYFMYGDDSEIPAYGIMIDHMPGGCDVAFYEYTR